MSDRLLPRPPWPRLRSGTVPLLVTSSTTALVIPLMLTGRLKLLSPTAVPATSGSPPAPTVAPNQPAGRLRVSPGWVCVTATGDGAVG